VTAADPLDELTTATVWAMLGHTALTRSPVDNRRAVLVLRAVGPAAVPVILEARARWLTWVTTTQRRWQLQTRRPSRARHHDSIRIRESYVGKGN
jgi:hypothetical protein